MTRTNRPSRALGSGATRPIRVSFEIFPPKDDAAAASLTDALVRLTPLQPSFVSVTCGAGGSTTDLTATTVVDVASTFDTAAAAHITCVSGSRDELDALVGWYGAAGVTRIVALRGDSRAGVGEPFQAHPSGYQSTPELIGAIKRIGSFDVSVSAYPEKHPESPTGEADLDMLLAKVEAGADRALTSVRRNGSPLAVAPLSQSGWPTVSRGSTMTPTPARRLPSRLLLSRCSTWLTTASPISISSP
jgi:methylenetetrahydrofolate reductase (NADPH)